MRAACFTLALAIASPTVSASGQLDPNFDDDGVATLDSVLPPGFNDRFRDGLIDPQGRLVGVGQSSAEVGVLGTVVRVRANGTLDPGFGDGGRVYVSPPAGYEQLSLSNVVALADGKLLIAGNASADNGNNNDFYRPYICRLFPNGSLDTDYGFEGCAMPPLWPDSNFDYTIDVELLADGGLALFAQTDADGNAEYEWAVARLTPQGQLDPCFGDPSCSNGGYVLEPEPKADVDNFIPLAMAVAPDGGLLLTGTALNGGNLDMVVIRLFPTGDVDTAFGDGGHRFVAFDLEVGGADRANDLAVDASGNIFAVGRVSDDFAILIGVMSLDANGDLRNGFGDNGRRVLFFDDVSPEHTATRVLLQDDGKLLVGGHTHEILNSGITQNCGILRLTAEGDLDQSFGISGGTLIDSTFSEPPGSRDGCEGLDARGGAIALFGSARIDDGSDTDSMFIKLDQDGLFRDGFEDGD